MLNHGLRACLGAWTLSLGPQESVGSGRVLVLYYPTVLEAAKSAGVHLCWYWRGALVAWTRMTSVET